MPQGFACPNPACTHTFPPEAVRGAASLTCPRCGTVFRFRAAAPGQAGPAPRKPFGPPTPAPQTRKLTPRAKRDMPPATVVRVVAVPVAPGPHGDSPGISRTFIRPARRLPAHCSVAVTSRVRNASRSVASESSSSRSTRPWTRSRQIPGSSSGAGPCPRT